jgi:hypothetical protein
LRKVKGWAETDELGDGFFVHPEPDGLADLKGWGEKRQEMGVFVRGELTRRTVAYELSVRGTPHEKKGEKIRGRTWSLRISISCSALSKDEGRASFMTSTPTLGVVDELQA